MRPRRRQSTRLPRPWDSPGKNTGVGCHFLLQCMKVKSESDVAQSCPTLRDPMDCSLPGSSIHGIFEAIVLEWGAIAFSNSPTRMVLIKNQVWQRYWETVSLICCQWELKTVLTLWKTVWHFHRKLNLPLDSTIPLLGIYPREMKTHAHTKMHMQMFRAALFITTPN